jgi:hypothetical protein
MNAVVKNVSYFAATVHKPLKHTQVSLEFLIFLVKRLNILIYKGWFLEFENISY